jgi:hypothetical protein
VFACWVACPRPLRGLSPQRFCSGFARSPRPMRFPRASSAATLTGRSSGSDSHGRSPSSVVSNCGTGGRVLAGLRRGLTHPGGAVKQRGILRGMARFLRLIAYLRISAAVVLALLAAAVAALWARSYWREDVVASRVSDTRYVEWVSSRGVVTGEWLLLDASLPSPTSAGPSWRVWRGWVWTSDSLTSQISRTGWYVTPSWRYERHDEGAIVRFPHWFLAGLFVGLAALLAVKRSWRFTTRGLLVATTLVAGMLGLIVYWL